MQDLYPIDTQAGHMKCSEAIQYFDRKYALRFVPEGYKLELCKYSKSYGKHWHIVKEKKNGNKENK